MHRFVWGILCWFVLCGLPEVADSNDEKTEVKERIIMGWVERIALIPWGIEVKAKLDSGAKTSSLHAKAIEHFEKEGEEWVRFIIDLEGKEKKKQKIQVERPLVRDVRIKQHKSQSKERPVVSFSFCLNAKEYEAQFSLVDRSRFNYPVLLGRRFLREVALIDPSKTFLTNEDWHACLVKYKTNRTSKDKVQDPED